MARKKKYRMKAGKGGYVCLTTPNFECIITKDEEKELTLEEFHRMKDFVEEVPVVVVEKSIKPSRKKRESGFDVTEEDK